MSVYSYSRMVRRASHITTAFIFLLAMISPTTQALSVNEQLYISAVKTGGVVEGELTEYVELYNQSDQNIDMTGLKLEYAKPSAKITDCNAKSWKQQDSSTNVKEHLLTGFIAPRSFVVIELSMTDNTGGSLRVSGNSIVYDLVGWGNAVSFGVCKETEIASMPVNKKTLMRYRDVAVMMQDTNNNKADFTLDNPVIDIAQADQHEADQCNNIDGLQFAVPVGYTVNGGMCEETLTDRPVAMCTDITISEILPNPAGTDTGVEYIELHNVTDSMLDLFGYQLKVGKSIKNLVGSIQPGYTIFTGLTLPNAAGATVELLSPTCKDVVVYPANLADDEVWAKINGQWQVSNQPTPNGINQASVTDETITPIGSQHVLSPCPIGKYRNPETIRCKNFNSHGELKPCEPGQARNPETNRCKSHTVLTADLKPCKANQVRNPVTNRCKKIETASLKACAEGQERNPATNRCKKVAGTKTVANTNQTLAQDVAGKQKVTYIVMAVVVLCLVGYGLYEYRDSVGNLFAKLRSVTKK